ncbi:MAG: NUDIX hydrolase [Spirochaetales bacterium]
MSSGNHDHLIWHEIETRTLLDAPIFRVYSSRRRAHDGAEGEYVLLDSPDWAHIVAPVVREDGVECFVMVRQYRHGSRSVTIEFPGGLVDEGEGPDAASLRELEEETGYTASALTLIGVANPNPAFMSNAVYTYVAHGARRTVEQRLDDNERVDAVLVPVREIMDLVPPSFHVHAIMMNALYWYSLYLGDGLSYDERIDRLRRR